VHSCGNTAKKKEAEVGPASGPSWRLSHLDIALLAGGAKALQAALPAQLANGAALLEIACGRALFDPGTLGMRPDLAATFDKWLRLFAGGGE
jgi:hypothetical protein